VAHGHGGVKLSHFKHTRDMAAIRMDAPKRVILPMVQSIGAPCEPLVKVGDTVKVGQKIGDSEKPMSAPIHASVSGTVTAVGEIRLATGASCIGVTIESDGKMEPYEGITPPEINSKEDLIKAVRESGCVGLGGAGFPTHMKLNVPKDKNIDTLIINAAECEPFITVDYREAVDNSWDVLSGVYTIKEILDIKHVIIAVEDNKPEAIEILANIASKSDEVDIMTLPSKYPQGAEKMIIFSTTGRVVPAGGLPSDVGCIVMNIATCAFISRYIKTGKPLVSRSITFDGTAVKNPQNLRVPIGTALQDIVDYCGGFTEEPEKMLMGGPMMGFAIYNLDAPLVKQNNAILAIAKHREKKERACINCGRCVSACPMKLTPTFIKKFAAEKNVEKLKSFSTMSCMECGCCAYSCPSGIPLVQYMRLAKQYIREDKK